jgi:toxin ParE1/3/4
VKAKPVVPRALARTDIEQAVDHLRDNASEKTALSLIDEVERAFSHIGRHPGTGSARYAHELDLPGLRAWPLSRHPYLVFYVEQATHIDVWRVIHARRNIPAWLSLTDTESPNFP